MKKVFLFCTVALLASGLSFGQTDKGKAKDSTTTTTTAKKKPMPKACPGKTCGKKKD